MGFAAGGASQLQTIGNKAFLHCDALTAIEGVSSLTSLQRIGDDFAFHAAGLTTLELSGLHSLELIGHQFAAQCSSLRRLVVRDTPNLREVGRGFAFACSA